MKKTTSLVLLISVLLIGSCNRIKDKSKDILAEQKDKLFPKYDHDIPNSENNKKRFKEFFGFNPTSDIDSIYCYADQLGVDHDYSFSFKCDTSTIKKIRKNLNLSNDSTFSTGFNSLFHDFEWWDVEVINELQPYWNKGEHEVHYFLWFDSNGSKAYYFEFDL